MPVPCVVGLCLNFYPDDNRGINPEIIWIIIWVIIWTVVSVIISVTVSVITAIIANSEYWISGKTYSNHIIPIYAHSPAIRRIVIPICFRVNWGVIGKSRIRFMKPHYSGRVLITVNVVMFRHHHLRVGHSSRKHQYSYYRYVFFRFHGSPPVFFKFLPIFVALLLCDLNDPTKKKQILYQNNGKISYKQGGKLFSVV